jgi:hypothetical protein
LNHGQMELDMKAIMWKGRNKALENSFGVMEAHMKEILIKII